MGTSGLRIGTQECVRHDFTTTLGGPMEEVMKNGLVESEVEQRLLACKDRPEIVDELYSFGQLLVRQVVEDIHHIDLKAGSLAAYCGATITLLVSTQGSWSRIADGWVYLSVIASGSAALLGAILAIRDRKSVV